MPTTKERITDWFNRGVKEGHHYLLVWCDTFDYEDYPEYFVGNPRECRLHVAARHGKNMQTIMEVYNLQKPLAPQLAQLRAFEYGG